MDYDVIQVQEGVIEVIPNENFSDINYTEFMHAIHELISQAAVLLFDMSNVVYINSLGLSILLNFHQTARNQDMKFILHSLGDTVMQVIVLSNLSQLMNIADDRAGALALAQKE